MNPKYPVYIISKGRANTRMTSKTLEEIGVPYRIVIEKSEYDDYAAVIDPAKILILPEGFREDPDLAFPDVDGRLGGSIPVRNWVWRHSIEEGHKKHWILDDNIRHFYRLNRNLKVRVTSGSTFRLCEIFTDRYKDIGMSGMNYAFFAPRSQKKAPFYLNTRIYSCILINNSVEHRWRGKYNEDTDLSLRVLKSGYRTILFNAYLCGKAATHSMKGGNTEEVYEVKDGQSSDNRREFAESLKAQHPDVVEVIIRWGRCHHLVNYRVFKQPLEYKDDYIPKYGINTYGLKMITAEAEK